MIEIQHIQKKYGKKSILTDISFRVQCGQAVALIGRNGCGKSTLLQIMAGVLKEDGGRIEYFGHCMTSDRKSIRRYCGYVPQENPLLEELSVRDNLRLWSEGRSDLIEGVVRDFGLDKEIKTSVNNLSGGMKRRLSIACAVLHNPPILLLDEPTTALDIYYQENIRCWLEEYRKKQGIILMATHDMEEILSADHCFIIQDGRLTELEKSQQTDEQIRKIITTL